MKKTLALFVVVFLLFGLIGCGKTEEKATSDDAIVKNPIEENAFESFENTLKEKGVQYEKIQMVAEYIGAEKGYKYKIENGTIELYQYDKTSEKYKKAEEKQTVSLEGFGDFSATVSNGYAMIINDLDTSTYVEIFQNVIAKQ